jgi:hypothetical protein
MAGPVAPFTPASARSSDDDDVSSVPPFQTFRAAKRKARRHSDAGPWTLELRPSLGGQWAQPHNLLILLPQPSRQISSS